LTATITTRFTSIRGSTHRATARVIDRFGDGLCDGLLVFRLETRLATIAREVKIRFSAIRRIFPSLKFVRLGAIWIGRNFSPACEINVPVLFISGTLMAKLRRVMLKSAKGFPKVFIVLIEGAGTRRRAFSFRRRKSKT
jgi:hypothetical protein